MTYPPRYGKEKMKDYNKRYKKEKVQKRDLRPEPRLAIFEMPLYPLDGAKPYCKVFACGKPLSLRESLFGSVCLDCSQPKERNIFQ